MNFEKYESDNKHFCCKQCQYKWRSQNMRGKKHPGYKGKIKYGTKQNYYAIFAPYHPFSDGKGYVMEHRLMMEKYLKRFLEQNEVVHHINGNRFDNTIENLRLMDKIEHDRMHAQERWNKIKTNFANTSRTCP
jgi:hypothetical protein